MLSARWIVTLQLIISVGQISFGQSTIPTDVTIYWTDNQSNMIQRGNVGEAFAEDLVTTGLVTPVAVTLDITGGKLYWADQMSFSVGRANLDGSSAQNIAFAGVAIHPSGVAVDHAAGKVYWTVVCDEACTNSTIRRANLDGSSMEILIDTGGFWPTGITLDIAADKLYWFDGRINRANTDGTDAEVIVAAGAFDRQAYDIALDVNAGHVYWAEIRGTVKRADLADGSNVQIIVADPESVGGLALDLLARKIYWSTHFGGGGIYRADMDGSNVELVQSAPIEPYGIALDVRPAGPQFDIPIAEVVAGQISTKNRFLSFSAGTSHQAHAIRVTLMTLPPPYDLWNGGELWVGPTSQVSEAGAEVIPSGGPTFTAATLRCEPFYTDWSSLGALHVFHEGIVPGGNYRVDVIHEASDPGVETNFSDPLPMTTAIWGDTLLDLSFNPAAPPEGTVNIIDAIGIIRAFQGQQGAIVKARADLEPRCPDLQINIGDVLSSLQGFFGLQYPYTPSAAAPCDSTCPNVLP